MIKQGLQIWLLMPAVATQKLRLVLLQQWWIYVQRCSDLGLFRRRMGPRFGKDLQVQHIFSVFWHPSKQRGSAARVDEEKSAHE